MRELKRRSLANRRAIAIAVAIASVAMFASLGGVGLAKNAIALAQYQYGKKLTICHKGKNTLTISVRAWPAHQRHGDTLGPCTTGHKPNNGKHKGNPHHNPNPGSDTGASSQSSTTGHTSHGNGNGNGDGNGNANTNGNSNGKGHG
jgi:uncharacterized membrane protein YgcG